MIAIRYKELKSGKYSIYLDIYTVDDNNNKKRSYEFLKLYVSKDYHKVKKVSSNDKNTIVLANSIRAKREIEITGSVYGINSKKEIKETSLLKFLKDHYEKTNVKMSRTLHNRIKEYIKEADINFTEVNAEWLEEFYDYLETQMTKNSARHYLKNLKARFNDAYRYDLIKENPFRKYDLGKELDVERTTLDYDEVQALLNTPTDFKETIRHAFLFSCFTGLRLSDVRRLKFGNIIIEHDKTGKEIKMLKFKPLKTSALSNKMLKIPLTNAAKVILNKIETKPDNHLVFHKLPSGGCCNWELRYWAAIAGIKKDVHFHVGRHTFATICLTYGMDIYTVCNLLGHGSVKTTEIYAKIVDEKKRVEIQKMPVIR